MRALRVLLLVSSTAWVAGTTVLVIMALLMFRHAPSTAHPTGIFEFVDHEAPGVVFGHMLSTWDMLVFKSLLPAVVLGAAGGLFAALRARRTRTAALWLIGILAVAGLHAWCASTTERAVETLSVMRNGHPDHDLRGEFNALHRQSITATGLEVLAVLALGVTAAAGLIRRDSASAGPDAG